MSEAKINKLKTALEAYLAELAGPPLEWCVDDAGVWTGDKAGSADVVMHYDCAGYDILSCSGDYAYISGGESKYHEKLYVIAKDHGFTAEPRNNWSMGFYLE